LTFQTHLSTNIEPETCQTMQTTHILLMLVEKHV